MADFGALENWARSGVLQRRRSSRSGLADALEGRTQIALPERLFEEPQHA
jgi:hypothetical protein